MPMSILKIQSRAIIMQLFLSETLLGYAPLSFFFHVTFNSHQSSGALVAGVQEHSGGCK